MELDQFLGTILNEEFTDISIYNGEAALFADKIVGGSRIAETFLAFAREESEHAHALMKIAGKTEGMMPRKIEVGPSLRQSLELHIRRETLSVSIYQELLGMLTEPHHKMMIKGIIAQEIEHLRAAKDYLLKMQTAHGKQAA